jgi:copper chaperone CopZ
MRKILLTILLLFGFLATYAQISKVEIIATGLTCSMCSNAINKQLKKLPEIDKVETDLNTNTFVVYLNKNNTLSPRILKERVEKAGFFVGSMIITLNFDSQKVTDDFALKQNDLDFIFIDSKSQIINGDIKLKILDNGYVTQKEHKKLIKFYDKYPSYSIENEDNYHVKIL